MDCGNPTMTKDTLFAPQHHDALKHEQSGEPDSASESHRAGSPRRLPIDCGELGLKILRDGTWLYHGSPIGRLPLVKLFASVLRREGDDYYLVTPAERGRVEVEDAPFLAVAVEARGAGRAQELVFRTNLDDIVIADADHPIRVAERTGGEPAPYILVRNGLEARLARPVFYDLVAWGGEEGSGATAAYGVWSRNLFFPLGKLAP
jgi:uncharacterized protein